MTLTRQRSLVNVQAYLPNDTEIIRIINGCALSSKGDWRIWQNSESPYLKIGKNRELHLRYKQEDEFHPEDIYRNAPPEVLAEISKTALLIQIERSMSFIFMGSDGLIRTAKCGSWWKRDPPLFYHVEDLRTLIKHENVELAQPVPCYWSTGKGWVTPWPPSRDFVTELEKENACNNLAKSLIEDFSVT